MVIIEGEEETFDPGEQVEEVTITITIGTTITTTPTTTCMYVCIYFFKLVKE